jgi:biotin-(acetyl-CoA carboxylase) ligase
VLLEALSANVGETISELEADPGAFVEDVSAVIATLGMEVVAELPGRPPVTGEATALAPDGSLLIRTSSGAIESVSAGDVRLRARPQQAP